MKFILGTSSEKMQSPKGKIFAGNILCQEHREMIHDANDRLVVSRTLLFSIRIHYVILFFDGITYRIRNGKLLIMHYKKGKKLVSCLLMPLQ